MQRLNSSRLESLTFLDNIFSLLWWHSHFGVVSSYKKLAKISVTFPHFPSTSGSEATPLNAINYVAERKSGLADVAGRTHNTQNCNHFLFIFDVVSQPSIAGKVLCSANRREKKRWNWIHYIFLLFFTFHSLRPEKRKLTFSSDDDFCVFAIFSRASKFIDSPAATVEACRVHLTQHKKNSNLPAVQSEHDFYRHRHGGADEGEMIFLYVVRSTLFSLLCVDEIRCSV